MLELQTGRPIEFLKILDWVTLLPVDGSSRFAGKDWTWTWTWTRLVVDWKTSKNVRQKVFFSEIEFAQYSRLCHIGLNINYGIPEILILGWSPRSQGHKKSLHLKIGPQGPSWGPFKYLAKTSLFRDFFRCCCCYLGGITVTIRCSVSKPGVRGLRIKLMWILRKYTWRA